MLVNTLLIHDTRTVGIITATVLARVLPRVAQDTLVDALYGQFITSSTAEFWRDARKLIGDKLRRNQYQTVILCCVGFDDRNERACSDTLRWLQSKVNLEIYSHKWPDGYTRAELDSLISPHAIAEKYGPYLEPVEWQLLRASLIASRETERELVTQREIEFANRLARNIWPRGKNVREQRALEKDRWDLLVQDLPKVLSEIQTLGGSVEEPIFKMPDKNPGFVVYELTAESPVSIEKALEAQSDDANFPNPGIAIGLVNWGHENGSQAYLLRPWSQRKNLPSIAHLLSTYWSDPNVPIQHWVGNQDAMHVKISPAQKNYRGVVENLKGRLRRFCENVGSLTFGSRQPHPWAAQFIYKQATGMLNRVDLTKRFVSDGRRNLYFDPEGIKIILSRSNRSSEPLSRTLSLRLVIENPDAAAFLFGYGGYNFTKLEMSLDGALSAIARTPTLWFAGTTVPSKLRIDACLCPLEGIGKVFDRAEEITTLSISDAVKLNVVESGSVIANALANSGRMIVFRGSETLGPSVQYASLAHLIIQILYKKLDRKVHVLELFSGSGYCSQKLLSPPGMARIVCVDSAVNAKTVGLETSLDIIWLRTSADQVLDSDGVYYQSYDIVLMDPPHGLLLDILFGRNSLVERASKVAPGLLIYVGHDSQSSRSEAVAKALAESYAQVDEWMVGSERLISAGVSKHCTQPSWDYDAVIEETFGLSQQEDKDRPWPFRRFRLKTDHAPQQD
jgi:16S rRNA G966 N2-methylase RsmD